MIYTNTVRNYFIFADVMEVFHDDKGLNEVQIPQ